MKKITVLLLILASAFVFTAANKNVKRVHNMPSGVLYDNWFPIGANHGIAVVGYEKNKGQNLDYAKGIYFVRKLDKWYPVYFEIGPPLHSK